MPITIKQDKIMERVEQISQAKTYVVKGDFLKEIEASNEEEARDIFFQEIADNDLLATFLDDNLLIEELVNINDASHPSRQKAIKVLEGIAGFMGNEEMFDCREGDTRWYDLEDMITNIIENEVL